MKLKGCVDWIYSQTPITRTGIYYLATAMAYLTARGISIMLGWNTRWI